MDILTQEEIDALLEIVEDENRLKFDIEVFQNNLISLYNNISTYEFEKKSEEEKIHYIKKNIKSLLEYLENYYKINEINRKNFHEHFEDTFSALLEENNVNSEVDYIKRVNCIKGDFIVFESHSFRLYFERSIQNSIFCLRLFIEKLFSNFGERIISVYNSKDESGNFLKYSLFLVPENYEELTDKEYEKLKSKIYLEIKGENND